MVKLSDAEVIAEIKTTSPLNRARQAFRFAAARIEQAEQRHKPLTAIETRRMEFEAVLAIAKELGVEL